MNTISRSTTVTFGECLGKGTYGRVYRCTTADGRIMAVKVVKNDKSTGPTELVEASIMRTYDHPNLASSIYVKSNRDDMFIFQDLAEEDISVAVKKQVPDRDTIRTWCFSLAQAVWTLHSENIIHCDIKPANVLKYSNGNIALTDFTLATVTKSHNDRFNHPICTLTYRAPEVFASLPWGFGVDIWSLGCTFYEIATGKMLVPFQGDKVPEGYKSGVGKIKLKTKTYNSLVRWGREREDMVAKGAKVNLDDDVTTISYHESFLDMSKDFQDLVLWMTEYNPNKRPTINEILKHPYFVGMIPSNYRIRSSPVHPITRTMENTLERTAGKYTNVPEVCKKAKEICGRAVHMPESKSYHFIVACLWIAAKLVIGGPLDIKDISNVQILDMEMKICNYLGYRLHTASMDTLFEK